ncbi:hypothetical protein COOONC_27175, partial [Cooperia oncophora]
SIGSGVHQQNGLIGDGVTVRRIRSIGNGVQHQTVIQPKSSIGSGVHQSGTSIGSGVIVQPPSSRNSFHHHKTSIGDGVGQSGVGIGGGVSSRGGYGTQNGHGIGTGAQAYRV